MVWSNHTHKCLNVQELQKPTGAGSSCDSSAGQRLFFLYVSTVIPAPVFVTSAIINDSKGFDPNTPKHKHV